MFLKSLVTSQILQRKSIPRPRCCVEPCQMRILCPGALCEAAQACEEKNGHTLEWFISRIGFLFCFVPLKGINSPSWKLELCLKTSQLLPVPFPAPEGGDVHWLWTSKLPLQGWTASNIQVLMKDGNVLIFCAKLMASFRDKICFLCRNAKGCVLYCQSRCDHVVFNTFLDPVNGNSFFLLLLFSVCHLGGENWFCKEVWENGIPSSPPCSLSALLVHVGPCPRCQVMQ